MPHPISSALAFIIVVAYVMFWIVLLLTAPQWLCAWVPMIMRGTALLALIIAGGLADRLWWHQKGHEKQ
jgi:hypothetical protein